MRKLNWIMVFTLALGISLCKPTEVTSEQTPETLTLLANLQKMPQNGIRFG